MSNVVYNACKCDSSFIWIYQLVLTVATAICVSYLAPIYFNIVQLSQFVQYLCRQSNAQTRLSSVLNSMFSSWAIRTGAPSSPDVKEKMIMCVFGDVHHLYLCRSGQNHPSGGNFAQLRSTEKTKNVNKANILLSGQAKSLQSSKVEDDAR